MYKKPLLILSVLAVTLNVAAQYNPWRSIERDTSRFLVHLSTGTAAVFGWGKGDAYLWTAPSVSYRATDRLTLSGGFAAVGSLLSGYELQQVGRRSLVPRKRGTQAMVFSAVAEYRATDRLTLWASVSHATGWYEPLWIPKGEALDLGITDISGGFAYEFSNESFLEMHFHFVHDHYGNAALGILGHPWYGYGVPTWELYGVPWPY